MLQKTLCLSFAAASMFIVEANASAAPQELKFTAKFAGEAAGVIALPNGLKAKAIHFNNEWKSSGIDPKQGSFKKQDGNAAVFTGEIKTPEGRIAVQERMSFPNSLGSMLFEATFSPEPGISTNELSLNLQLPCSDFAGSSLKIDQENLELPAQEPEKWFQAGRNSFKQIIIPGSTCKLVIQGNGPINLQDDRRFGSDSFSLRFKATPSQEEPGKFTLKLSVLAQPYNVTPLDLKQAMNMGFKDDVAEDGKGGWTDQGPANDLRMIKPGQTTLCGATMDIVDPAKNAGRSCIVLSGSKRGGFPVESKKVELGGVKMKNLCLLHAAAWPPEGGKAIGRVLVEYGDGSKGELPIVAGREAGNWWAPNPLPNGKLAWTGENASSYVGLFLSELPVEPKPVKSIAFKGESDSIWMIAAASASNDTLPTLVTPPFYIVESKAWRPLEMPRAIEKGSALDFSSMVDAPAGKHGRLIIRNGKFAFEDNPSKPQRFYGVNLCFTANYLDKETCDKLAEQLAASGYNTVRFHHHDNQLFEKSAPGKAVLSAENADKLDYLFSALKKRGIYITTDLYVSRDIPKGSVKELDSHVGIGEMSAFKALVLVSDSARENWETFASALLNHVNPYTGMAWKDDPALVFLNLVNEGNVESVWSHSPEVRAVYEAKFNEWLGARKLTPAPGSERSALMRRFLSEAYASAYGKMREFLLKEGVKTPFSDQNMSCSIPLTLMRERFDYVDSHFYRDHPSFPVKPWSLPSSVKNRSAIEYMASSPGYDFASRIFGKPFTITEFNWAFPNAYRGESGPLTGAYASLQGWDALYRFAYSHSSKVVAADGTTGYFDVAADPITTLSDRIGTLLFLRGDVAESSLEMPILVKDSWTDKGAYPRLAWQLGLVGKVGAVVERDGKAALPSGAKACITIDSAAPSGMKPLNITSAADEAQTAAEAKSVFDFGKGSFDPEAKTATSSTGELSLDGKAKTFKAVTPRSETFVLCGAGAMKGGLVSVENKSEGASTLFVASLDGKKLDESSRLLALHLTNAMNSKTKFGSNKMNMLESYGSLPHLICKGEAEFKIKLANGSPKPKVYAIDLSGKRLGEVESKLSADGELSFLADTFAFKTPCMAYEIARQ